MRQTSFTRIQAHLLLLSACGWWRYIKFVLHILARQCTSSLPGFVQYGGGKELATLPHSIPGLLRLAVVVWGVLCVGTCACRYVCVCVCASGAGTV
jgi:hypothetical protein